MSTDDIVFDDVKYREPKRVRRPDRDRRWACVAYEIPASDDLPIFLDRKPADAIERHALRDTSVELGGILLGTECLDDQTNQPFVWITESLEAKHYENTQASFTYTHDSWEEMTRERDRLHPDLDIVGWYHTHPDFGIFLSSHDLFIHRNFFDQPLQLAYVVDPIRQTRGFFRWRDGTLEQVGGYFLSSDRNDRLALARLVNDLESIPNADPVGGGLSPRLEAELIAMLSRPHQASMTSPANQAQIATMFGTLGLFAGILIVAVAGWLFMVAKQVSDQTVTLAEMKRTAEKTEQVQELAIETLLIKAGSGDDARKFVQQLAKSRKELEDSQHETNRERLNSILVTDELLKLKQERDKLRAEQAEKLIKNEKDKNYLEELQAKVRRQDELLSSYTRTDIGLIHQKYQYAWWTAAASLGVAVIASLGLLALWASKNPLPEADPSSTGPSSASRSPSLSPIEEPPHQIS